MRLARIGNTTRSCVKKLPKGLGAVAYVRPVASRIVMVATFGLAGSIEPAAPSSPAWQQRQAEPRRWTLVSPSAHDAAACGLSPHAATAAHEAATKKSNTRGIASNHKLHARETKGLAARILARMAPTAIRTLGLTLVALVACGSSAADTTPGAKGGAVTLRGVVLDQKTGSPVAGAIVAVERGGLYLPIADYGQANPAYAFGAVTGADGLFAVDVASGLSGVHAFGNDFLYRGQPFDSNGGGSITVRIESRAAALLKPTITNASLQPKSVAPGAQVTVRADLHAGVATDPLSDEVLIVEPKTGWAGALAPPSAGSDRDHYPDGAFTRAFAAPTTPGTYTYRLTATTGGCVNADAVALELTVQ